MKKKKERLPLWWVLMGILIILFILAIITPNQVFYKVENEGYITNISWIEQNCNCVEQTCTIHYNYSEKAKLGALNSSMTWYGPIEFTEGGGAIFYKPGAQIVQDCEPCEKYTCDNINISR